MLTLLFASLLTASTLFSGQQILSLADFPGSQPKQQIETLVAIMSNRSQLDPAAIEQYLTLALDAKDRDVRAAALYTIGMRASAWRARQLSSPRNDAIAAILLRGRLAALDALRDVMSTQVTAFVIERLADPAPSIRARALNILGSQQTATVIPRILEILASDLDWYPRWNAAHALTMMWPYSRHALADVEARESKDTDPRVREEIGRTLLNLRRRFPGEHARVVDAAYPDLIARVRTGVRQSESPRSIRLPVDPSSSIAVVRRTDRDVITSAVCGSDLVVIGRINPVSILLDTHETFLFAQNTVAIDEVLHGQGAHAGAQLLYVRPGGSMRLKGQEVRTEHLGYASGWIYNRRQIMFLKHVAGVDAVKAALPVDILFLDAGTVLRFKRKAMAR